MDEGLSVIEDLSANTGIHWHVDISHSSGISAQPPIVDRVAARGPSDSEDPHG